MDRVTVLCPNGHRVGISTSRHTSLAEILEEACKKKNFDPELHILEHHSKKLDLSSTIHLANLPKNSLLEMIACEEPRVVSSTPVSLCIQLESGERITNEFKPAQNLSEVFNYLREQGKLEETSGDEVIPVFSYLRREIVGISEFEKTTLQRLGLTQGRAIIRLLFRRLESFGQQAGAFKGAEKDSKVEPKGEIPWRAMRKEQPDKPDALISKLSESTPEKSADPSEQMETSNKSESEKVDTPMDTRVDASKTISTESTTEPAPETEDSSSTDLEEDPVLEYIDENVVLFRREGGTSLRVDVDNNLDDNFFELTIEDAIKIQADLRRKLKAFDSDEPLMTEEMRRAVKEGEKLATLNRYPRTVVRIQFPDLFVLQGIFLSGQTIGEVKEFIRRYLSDPEAKFFLLIPPNNRLDPESTLLDADCVPSCLLRFIPENLNLGNSEAESPLRDELLSKLSNAKGADKAVKEAGVVKLEKSEGKATPTGATAEKKAKLDHQPTESTVPSSSNEERAIEKPSSSNVVPRWFVGTGKKK